MITQRSTQKSKLTKKKWIDGGVVQIFISKGPTEIIQKKTTTKNRRNYLLLAEGQWPDGPTASLRWEFGQRSAYSAVGQMVEQDIWWSKQFLKKSK